MALRYKFREAAALLDISPAQLENIVNAGLIAVHSDSDAPGAHRFVSQRAIDAYIEAREATPIRGKRMAS